VIFLDHSFHYEFRNDRNISGGTLDVEVAVAQFPADHRGSNSGATPEAERRRDQWRHHQPTNGTIDVQGRQFDQRQPTAGPITTNAILNKWRG